MKREGDIVASVKGRVSPDAYNLATAEGRADFDDALRLEIWRLAPADKTLRRHAGVMIQEWRNELFAKAT